MRIIAFITFSADIQRYWITSKSRRKLPASPRHAGHHWGRAVFFGSPARGLRRRGADSWGFRPSPGRAKTPCGPGVRQPSGCV